MLSAHARVSAKFPQKSMAGFGQGSNPCNVLNSYHNGCHYTLSNEVGPPHSKLFTMAVNVMGEDFVGTGRSKKLAKQAAAAEALRKLYNLQLSLSEQSTGVCTFSGLFTRSMFIFSYAATSCSS